MLAISISNGKRWAGLKKYVNERNVPVLTLLKAGAVVATVLFLFFLYVNNSSSGGLIILLTEPGGGCSVPHDQPDGGDCEALGEMRRPSWACLSAMKASLPEFITLYRMRPFKRNSGGMRLDQSFALWYMLRRIRPATIIESGANKGHSTWIIRNALPTARIISMDPMTPIHRIRGVEYMVSENFTDFGSFNWEKFGDGDDRIDVEDTLVFIDDHQSSYKRLFAQNTYGFRHFIVEDNYDFATGDSRSLRHICETRRRNEWPGYAPDNFGKIKKRMSWDEHLAQGRQLKDTLQIYYEFPPVTDHYLKISGTSKPVVTERGEFDSLFKGFGTWEFSNYHRMAYAKLRA